MSSLDLATYPYHHPAAVSPTEQLRRPGALPPSPSPSEIANPASWCPPNLNRVPCWGDVPTAAEMKNWRAKPDKVYPVNPNISGCVELLLLHYQLGLPWQAVVELTGLVEGLEGSTRKKRLTHHAFILVKRAAGWRLRHPKQADALKRRWGGVARWRWSNLAPERRGGTSTQGGTEDEPTDGSTGEEDDKPALEFDTYRQSPESTEEATSNSMSTDDEHSPLETFSTDDGGTATGNRKTGTFTILHEKNSDTTGAKNARRALAVMQTANQSRDNILTSDGVEPVTGIIRCVCEVNIPDLPLIHCESCGLYQHTACVKSFGPPAFSYSCHTCVPEKYEDIMLLRLAGEFVRPDRSRVDIRCRCSIAKPHLASIQCNGCYAWQHKACMGLNDEKPEKKNPAYFCHECKVVQPLKRKNGGDVRFSPRKRNKANSSSTSPPV